MEREYEPGFGGVDEPNSEPEINHPDNINDDLPDELPAEDYGDESIEATDEHPQGDDIDFDPEEEFRRKQAAESQKKKKPNHLKAQLEQVMYERYKTAQELQNALEENQNLRMMANTSSEAAVKHYMDSATMRLANARKMKEEAYESGMTAKMLDADTEFQLALNEVQQANQWNANQKYQAQQRQQQQQREAAEEPHPLAGKEPFVNAWLARNEWFNGRSENYDEALAAETELYTSAWNQNLINAGYGDQIGSPDYFHHLDNHISELKKNMHRQSNQKRNLSMQSPRGGASSVRGGRAFESQRQPSAGLSSHGARYGSPHGS